MATIINFLNTYAAGLTILITLVVGVYKFWQLVNIKRSDALQRDYVNFHDLIGKLVVDRQHGDGRPFIDIQIASVYELKNYPRYYRVSSVILERMKIRLNGKPEQADLIKEIDKVHSYINKNWFFRKLSRI
jgi:hypothetical protein